ncbi:MAG: DUF2029 domain-containing protein [Phycisphaeraceae bacterium]|nr:DUF2029 domain-containing protein [Phycisphaeraceae bacterium]
MVRFIARHPWMHSPRFLLGVYIALALILSAYQFFLRPDSIKNLVIFRNSFDHLLNNDNLYLPYEEKQFDVFRYSPTFALFMAPLRALPLGAAVVAWNLCNALALFLAARKLPIKPAAAAGVLLFVIPQLSTSMQNNQSNGLMAGLMIGTLAAFECRRPILAAMLASFGFFIKIYGAAVGMLFLCFKGKARFIIGGLACVAALWSAPAAITGFGPLITHYQQWREQVQEGGPRLMKYSVMTVTEKWTGVVLPDWYFILPGLLLLLLPLRRVRHYANRRFRIMFAAYITVFVVVFNPMAESPTYIIAMAGAAVWGLVEPRSWLRSIVLLSVFFITGLSHSDLCPSYIRHEIVAKYGLKAVPCIAAWLIMAWRLNLGDPDRFSTIDLLDGPTASGTPSAVPRA